MWLVIMRSTVQTRLSLAQCQPANADLNLAADDRRTERSNLIWYNHADVIVSNIENIIRLFLSFGSCIQNPLGSKIWGTCPSLWMGMTPLTLPLHAREGLMSRFYKLLVWSLGKHSLHCIIEHKYGQGFTSFLSSSTSAEYDGVSFSAGSAS